MNASENAAWPNIILLAGDVYGLGVSVRLPTACVRPSALLATSAAEYRHARPLRLCIATKPAGRQWLEDSGQAGMQPALVNGDVVMVPSSIITWPRSLTVVASESR
jgi:hypothetical protein